MIGILLLRILRLAALLGKGDLQCVD